MENTTIVDGMSGIIEATGKLVIKNFARVMGGFKPGMCIESDSFMLGDIPLSIMVYPNGDKEENKGHVSLFLYNDGDENISVKGQLITELRTMDFDYTETLKPCGGDGVDNFLTHAQCADAYKDKDFVVEA